MSHPDQPRTVGDLLGLSEKFLMEKGSEHPRLDAQVLLARCLGCPRIDLYGARFAELVPDDVRREYRDLIRQRVEGCPVAYLVGKKEFFSLEFEVSPAVLIPRPDTESLVNTSLDLARKLVKPRVLDIGTGSGAIAVALAKHLPEAEVTATDSSAAALEVARRNAARHGVAERIQFLHGSLFEPLPPGAAFDFIVSNPPYIPTRDIAGLAPGVRDFEPHQALDGGPDGFAFLDALIEQVAAFLVADGCFLVEIGSPQEQAARAKLAVRSHFQLAPTVFDLSRHPRVLWARYQPR